MVVFMAKKKKSSQAEKANNFGYSVELTGLVLILIGLIGFGFGPVGSLLKKFAMFLLGEWWPIVLLLVLSLGCLMLFKRKLPNFFNSKYIGLYLIIIVILVLSHLNFIKMVEHPTDIFSKTIQNYMDRIASIGMNNAVSSSGQTSITIGGGIAGAIFSFGTSVLFGLNGTYIVLVFLAIFGIVLFFNINISDIFNNIIMTFKNAKERAAEQEMIERTQALDRHLFEQEIEVEKVKKPEVIEEEVPKRKHEEIARESEEVQEEVIEPRIIMPDLPNANPNAPTINPNYQLPAMNLLDDPVRSKKINSNQFLIDNKQNLERVLNDFHISGKVVDIHMGPSVTQFEVTVPSGTRVSRISSINKEIALALAAKDVRIEAPIPGKSTIGIEIPNQSIAPVKIKEILASKQILDKKGGIWVALGKDIMGIPQCADLSRMPHLLVAGSTGSGKSVCINSIISSILMRYRPDEVKMILVDPKQVELSNYNGVPHLLCPVVNDPKKASLALQKIVVEMDRRYKVFADKGVKKIDDYNELIDKENDENGTCQAHMHYIVAIIDELADLMLVASKEVEESIMRITQLARAAGIHLIVATQRPSTDVITGVVKSNIPSRISFAVASNIDSRTILDSPGAEKLLGKGDMLYLPMGENHPIRIQGCFISDDEIRRVIDAVCKEQVAQYDEALVKLNEASVSELQGESDDYDEPMYDEIVEFAYQTGKISASLIQRRFRFGYNRAARVIDLLEKRGIVGPANGSKPRDVIMPNSDEEE